MFSRKGHTEPYERSPINSFFPLLHILGGSLGVLVAPLLFLKNSTTWVAWTANLLVAEAVIAYLKHKYLRQDI